jgi:FAD synthetase
MSTTNIITNSSRALPNHTCYIPLALSGKPLKIGIAYAMWNASIVNAMKANCIKALKTYGSTVSSTIEVCVPGSYEVPTACKKLTESCDAVIALGCLFKGATTHMETIEVTIARSLHDITFKTGIPIISGVIACYDEKQAIERTVHGFDYGHGAVGMTTLQAQIDLQSKINESHKLIEKVLEKNNASLCFNGGKDSLVVLDLLSSVTDITKTPIIFFNRSNELPEIQDTISKCKEFYKLDEKSKFKEIKTDDMKEGLKTLITDGITAVFMGKRNTDELEKKNISVTKSSNGWPEILQVNPIADWTYAEVWFYILSKKLPFCSLYESGYSSIGTKTDSKPNPALNGKPAWFLTDASAERSARK